MTYRPDEPLTPEEQAFDQFLDELVRSPPAAGQQYADDLRQFSARLIGRAPALAPESLASDPVLRHLLDVQRGYAGDSPQPGKADAARPYPAGQSPEAGETPNRRLSRPFRTPKSSPPSGPGAYPIPVAAGGDSAGWLSWARIPLSMATLLLLGVAAALLYTVYFDDDGNRRVAGPIGLLDKAAPTATEFSSEPVGSAATPGSTLAVTIDGVEIKINSCESIDIVETNLTDEEPRRDKFLALSVTMTNMSGSGEITFSELAVHDEINEPYSLDLFATLLANDVVMTDESFANIELEPGVPHDMYLIFDVFAGSTTLKFTDADGSFTLLLPDVCANGS